MDQKRPLPKKSPRIRLSANRPGTKGSQAVHGWPACLSGPTSLVSGLNPQSEFMRRLGGRLTFPYACSLPTEN
ncbi:hypothetical protein DSM3645_03618 [Blastopirellula marina DSM 3645]|uniref:Uncharacterized protein n=1 Tax=Blastopirellula marina DSM 3645 TaxID=314230 RepID=A3ZW35_9BACT|nr:hypothetical protein DSM3645_03618 [Blastopirellula marina DSM 3645]